MTSGIKMICYQIPSVSADTGLPFPHPQVVARGRPFRKSEIISVASVEGQPPPRSSQRAAPLLAETQTGDAVDFSLLLAAGCWPRATVAFRWMGRRVIFSSQTTHS